MDGITVKELKMACDYLIRKGYGDKTVLLSSDDEGNEYHTLYYTFLTDKEEIRQLREYGMFHDNNNAEDVVILG